MLAVGLINQMNKIENSITQNSILSSVTDMQNVTWKDLVSKDLVPRDTCTYKLYCKFSATTSTICE